MKIASITIERCARCQKEHPLVDVKELSKEASLIMELPNSTRSFTFTHWAMCPSVKEPMLLRFSGHKVDGI